MTTRQTWDYLSEHDLSLERLAKLGAEGWELVGIAPARPDAAVAFYFKRPAATLRERVTLDHRQRFESNVAKAPGSDA